MRPVAGGDNFIHHSDRSQRPQLRILVLRIQGPVVLDLLDVVGEILHLRRFLLVAQRNVSLEGCLVAEQIIVVRFVRTDGNVDRRIELHPSHIARVVVVCAEGLGAQRQEIFERGIRRHRSRFFEQLRRTFEICRIRLAIGHRYQLLVGFPADHREKSAGLLLLSKCYHNLLRYAVDP